MNADTIIGLSGILIMVILLLNEVPLAFSMGIVGLFGYAFFSGFRESTSMSIITAYTYSSNYTLACIPLFILMGEIACFAGAGRDLYSALYAWCGRLRGGLAMATIGACTVFGAICGSSPVTAITIGSIALPEMERFKYQSRFSTGCIAAAGTISILIPPSVPMVIYGIITEQSIGRLFIAGVGPGLLMASLFFLMTHLRVRFNPALAPQGPSFPMKEKLRLTWKASSLFTIFILVVGGIYLGLFTATEAAGMGAFAIIISTLLQRRLTKTNFLDSLRETTILTATIMAAVMGCLVYTTFTVVAGLPEIANNFVNSLGANRYIILSAILLVYLVLGCIMDVIGMLIFTLPIFFPIVTSLGFDPIWFGVLCTIMVECALITPPVGFNCMVVRNIAGDKITTGDLFVGIGWFFAMQVVTLVLIILFPQIVLFLPNLMFAK